MLTEAEGVPVEAAELDSLLGPPTTAYRIRGRIGGAQFDLAIDPLGFAKQVILDAFREALPAYWVQRAEAFHWAQPRTTDFHGQSGPRETFAALHRCRDTAQACLAHAELLSQGDPWGQFERDALAFLDEFDARWPG